MESSEEETIALVIKSPGEIRKILKERVHFEDSPEESIKLLAKLLFGSTSPSNKIEEIKKIQVPVGVCGRIIENYDLLWFCKTCGMTPNSGICQDCYTNSDHTGHETFFRKGYIGVCDCGDPDSWKSSGFCSKHKGYDEKKISLDLLPPYVKEMGPAIFHFLGKIINKAALEYRELPETGPLNNEIIKQIMALFDQLTNVSAIFAKLVCQVLNERMFAAKPKGHVCNFTTFLSKEEEAEFPIKKNEKLAKLEAKGKKDPVCECKVLENLIKVIHRMSQGTLFVFCEYLVKMTKSPLLKDLMGYGLLSNYRTYVAEASFTRISDEEPLDKLGLQIFTVDDLAHRYLQKKECRNAIMDVVRELVKRSKVWNGVAERDLYVSLFLLKRDIKYFTRPKTMGFLVDNTEMLSQLLVELADLEFVPLFKIRSTHIENDLECGSQVQPFTDKHWNSICISFLKNFDYSNLDSCRLIGSLFSALLAKQAKKAQDLSASSPGSMYFTTQLHRCFYTFLSTILHVHLASLGGDYKTGPTEALRKDCRGILRRVFTETGTDQELDALIKSVLEVALTPLFFMIEIKSKKWINYGGYMEGMATFYFRKNPGIYFYPDFGLIQLLVGLYEGKERGQMFEFLTQVQKKADYLKCMNEMLTTGEIAGVDPEKSRSIIEGILHLLCCLCTNDSIGLLPLIRLSYETATNRDFLKQLKPSAEKAREYYFKKQVIHYSMKSPNGQFTYNDLMQSLPKKVSKAKGFEGLVSELCNSTKNQKGQVLFSIKPEKLYMFDPYNYPTLSEISQTLDNTSQMFKKAPFDGMFGTMPALSKEDLTPVPLNMLFIERIMSPELVNFITKIVTAGEKVATETIKMSAFKLMFVFARFCNKGYRGLPQVELYVEKVKENAKEIFAEIKKRANVNDMQKYSFGRLAQELASTSPEFAVFLEGISAPSEEQKEEKVGMKEKQQKIMEEFKKRQEKFLHSHYTQVQSVPKAAVSDVVCSVCGGHLNAATFTENPYGKLVFAEKSMRQLQAKKQVLTDMANVPTSTFKTLIDLPYVNHKGEGLRMVTCTHYAHVSCLKEFYKRESDLVKGLFTPKLGGLLRFCPICRTGYTWLVPVSVPSEVNEDVVKLAIEVCEKVLEKSIKANKWKDMTALMFYNEVLQVAQYNFQQIDLTGISGFLDDVEYLSPFLLYAIIYGNSRQFNASEILKELEKPLDATLLADRSRVLVDKLFSELITRSVPQLLPPETVSSLIENQYKLNLYSIMLKMVIEKHHDITPEALVSLGAASKEKVIADSIQFIKKSIAAFCLFCAEGKKLAEKAKVILQTEDTGKIWESVKEEPFASIKFAKILEEVLQGANIDAEIKSVCENTINEGKAFTKQLELLATPLRLKLFPMEKSYKELILKHYQKACYHCNTQFKEKGLCLHCGTVVCMEFCEKNAELRRGCKGFITHSKECQGKSGLYLRMSNGGIVLYYRGLYSFLNSPYLTNFGESMTVSKDQDADFKLSEVAAKELEDMQVQDKLPLVSLSKLMDLIKHQLFED
eukprot:TRINITY_DN1643_c0_g1_i1.p1 TRINITY_DN1643_c0_g1~~TRINITY_DN1643_c0_g1_i1.p1  ORF type:complete len:1530 (-),score=223.10 TRINITY_DN1643_c0_g1_i1:18684-23273(-)